MADCGGRPYNSDAVRNPSSSSEVRVMPYPFTLPPLPYDAAALEPHIDAQTMTIHHGKHHATYVTKLNEALEKAPQLQKKGLTEILADLNAVPEAIRTAVRNNGGGHWNHSAFWTLMKKGGGGAPKGNVGKAIDA